MAAQGAAITALWFLSPGAEEKALPPAAPIEQ
jgi:hypothetical protein